MTSVTTYPTENPTCRHDFIGPWPLPTDLSNDELLVFPDMESILRALPSINAQEMAQDGTMTKLSVVYSYPDAPTSVPFSRNMVLIGFVPRDVSLRLTKRMTQSTIGVKRADPKYRPHLKYEDKRSSDNFALLMKLLKKNDYVGLLGRDRHSRVLIIVPGHDTDYAAGCFHGGWEDLEHVGSEESEEEEEDWQQSPKYLPDDEGRDISSPTYKPADDDDNDNGLWQPESSSSNNNNNNNNNNDPDDGSGGLWQPEEQPSSSDPNTISSTDEFWQPPTTTTNSYSASELPLDNSWTPANLSSRKRPRDEHNNNSSSQNINFHADSSAAAADRFYSNLTRELTTRADSRLFHMRSFNGWVKATQIAELDPQSCTTTSRRGIGGGLRILDLACGKGGDLGKWTLHRRGIKNYIGIDVARGSLKDAAKRALRINRTKLPRCSFVCADLGSDVPGRRRCELLTWVMGDGNDDDDFNMEKGGGVKRNERFDVISIQFAIHYMMSSVERARRFFKTVGDLLEMGGNLVATTIDARVVLEKMMGLGLDWEEVLREDDDNVGDGEEGEQSVVVEVGKGACRLTFPRTTVKRLLNYNRTDDDSDRPNIANSNASSITDQLGLEYTFTLVEGDDHSKGIGDAVNLPEWLTPLPVLTSLASEAGLELSECDNFHQFYNARQNPHQHPSAHRALGNMHVLNHWGSISEDEWEVSRMYMAIKFTKVRDCHMVLEGDEDSDYDEDDDEEENDNHHDVMHDEDEDDESELVNVTDTIPPPIIQPQQPTITIQSHSKTDAKKLPMAMMKAKRVAGDLWQTLTQEEKTRRINEELSKM